MVDKQPKARDSSLGRRSKLRRKINKLENSIENNVIVLSVEQMQDKTMKIIYFCKILDNAREKV